PSEKNVIIMGLKFEEIKEERPILIDEQIATGKSRGTIRDAKYVVLEYYQGNIKTIKERISEFFKNSKTKNIVRINKADAGNEKVINEIREFVKQESSKIDFPPAKIRFTTCDLQRRAKAKKKYTDARSEAYYGLENLRKRDLIEFSKLGGIPDLKKEIIHQLSTVSYPRQSDERKKVDIAEDLSYEFLDALVFFIWNWGMAFAFC
ncbi:hypothetical protein LCGC14_2911850, partial [marine sediment metagenome]